MKRTYSLRSRLITWISLPILIATLLTVLISYIFARHEIEEVYDAQLVHSAKVLLQLTHHEILEDEKFNLGLEDPDLQHRYERKLGFRIWVDNDPISQSTNTADFKDFEAPPGFSNQTIGKHRWRFFVFLDPADGIKIEVSERYDIRYELIIQLMSALILPALFFIPTIVIVVWIGVRKVLHPVVRMSVDVDQRSSDDLSPIAHDRLPQEIAPFVQALNRLFKRLEESFRREREFTDHAAHELRTPLAAMKTQTQVLIKKAGAMEQTGGISECAEGLLNLETSINRATHLVEQLLLLARLQNEDLPKNKMDLSACVLGAIEDIRRRAAHKNIHLKTKIMPGLYIHGHDISVGILLNNLLGNAVKYTPEGGSVDITLEADGTLCIADTGPGLNDQDKVRVFKRFVRADKSGQTGSGLGLSIAQWVAHAHDVQIELSDHAPTGLSVKIKWDILPASNSKAI
ncbi:MAG: sensor histidine kinase N-terminal domain-containing protein [Alphaproteobacteria bacterium]|nr:sensor histidine kinase N-terminal domain-containing protein [Alphaproteobacteria bacterium]